MKKTQSQLKLLLAALLCAFVVSSKGQTVWNKTYVADRPLMVFSSVINIDSFYYTTGITADLGLTSFFSRSLIGKIDRTGNLVNYKSIFDTTNKGYSTFDNSLIKNDKNELVYCGFSSDSVPHVLFVKQNLSTDSITVSEYSTPNSYAYAAYQIIQYGSDYFMSGVRTDRTTNNADCLLMKIDSNGSRLWEKYYDQNALDYASNITKLSNGNLLLGCVRNDLNHTNQHTNTWLMEVDTGGNFVRQWFDPNDSTYVAEGLKQTQDGGFIYGAQKKFVQTVNDVYKTATIVKMDSNFNKQWTFLGGSYNDVTGIYDLEELPDGSFVGCGNKPFYNGDSSVLSGWIIKLSSTGNEIWSKIYRGINASHTINLLTDIDVLPDGSFIAVGQCQQNGHVPAQVGWFLKLDSNGCEIENCLTTDISQSEIRNPKFAIFPNPASDQVYIESAITTQGELSIADELGRALYTNPHFDGATAIKVNNWMNGIYFYRLRTATNEQQSGKIVVQH